MNVVRLQRREFEPRDPPPTEDQGAQLRGWYALVLRRWGLIASTAMIVFSAVCAFTMLSPRMYTATALVMVNPSRQQVLEQGQMIDDSSPNSAAVDSEIEVLRSQVLARRLVDALSLQRDPEWNGALRQSGALALVFAPIREVFSSNNPASAVTADSAVVSRVARAIAVRRRGLSYGIDVSVTSRNPARAAQLTNKYLDLYLQSQVEARFDLAQRANTWLAQRLNELRLEVQQKEEAAEAFRVQHNLSVAAAGDQQPTQSDEVQALLVQARADLAEKEARLRQVRELEHNGGSVDSIASVLNSPVIGELRAREAEAAQQLARLRERYSDEHPAVQVAQTQLQEAHQRIADEVTRIRANLQNEVDVARARLGTLQGSFGDAAGARGEDSQAVVQYRELVREAAAARAVHDSFLQRYHELSNQGDLPVATSRVVSSATPPGAPSAPNWQVALLTALLLGGGAGFGMAFLVESLDSTLAGADDVERKIGAPAVASIPALRPTDFRALSAHRRNPPDYLAEKPMSGFAEALRVLRTAVMHARLDKKVRVLAITSAAPNEGKTTLSLCLARIAATSGQSVVLVDCDLRRRSLNELLQITPRLGLLQTLSGEANWRDTVVPDPESGAHVLPTTSSSFTPRDVFSSQAMHRLIEELRQAYDLVILDGAPVLAIADTRIVVTHADVTAIVVRADKTPAHAVRAALQEVQNAGAELLGVALNCVDTRKPGRNYYGETTYYRYAEKSYYRS